MPILLILLVILFSFPANVIAQPALRGFQSGLPELDEDKVRRLSEEWGTNIVRLQIGNNEKMDGNSGESYRQMMNEIFQLVDERLPWFQKYNIQVILSFYSPPGGFLQRESPAHHALFSNPTLQAEYLSTLREIASRYGNNPIVYAIDIMNEPAMQKNRVCAGCRNWSTLVEAAVAEIRSVDPDVNILIKSEYGDPKKLTKLPLFNDIHVIYGYHAYLFRSYQSAGIDGRPVNKRRPSFKKIHSHLLNLTGRFVRKYKRAFRKRRVPIYPPRLNVGEFAVSSCSQKQPEIFLKNLLQVIERDDLTRFSRRERKRLVRGKSSRIKNDVTHESWTFHAIHDALVWDPRFSCIPPFQFVFTGNSRIGDVLKEYFSRNYP